MNACTSKGQTALHVAVEMAENRWLNRPCDYQLTIKLLLGAKSCHGGAQRLQAAWLARPLWGSTTTRCHPCAPRDAKSLRARAHRARTGSGSDINMLDGYGQAPLHVATKNLDLPTMSMLLDHGARVDAGMDPDGRTPL